MRKKLIYTDTERYRTCEHAFTSIENKASHLRAVIQTLPPAGKLVGTSEQFAEVIAHQSGADGYLKDFIKSQMPDQEFGVQVDKEARLNTLRLPDTKPVDADLKLFKRDLAQFQIEAQDFEVSGATDVKLKASVKERILEGCKLYATTDEEMKLWELHQSLFESWSRFKTWYEERYSDTNLFDLQQANLAAFFTQDHERNQGMNFRLFTISQTRHKKELV